MPKLTFYPLGNADCCLMDLENGKKLLFDYAATRCQDDENDKRIDLPKTLKDDLKASKRNHYEVVSISHLDIDHFKGFSEFFYLEHAAKYQSGDRVKMDELWVPAAAIIEEKDSLGEEHRIVQNEARYRLRNRSGIRVFSRPDLLKNWLSSQNMNLDDVRHLITDAGQLVPNYNLANDGSEFFVHSPFAKRLNETEVIDRNSDSIVMQVTFDYYGVKTKLILGADTTYDEMTEIVDITKHHNREERLEWNIVKLPHHCSYLSLGPEKGKTKTEPVPNVKYLYEEKGSERGIIVSPSDIIYEVETVQPPHFQAANYYKEVLGKKRGEFKVTMEHPTKTSPKPLVIRINAYGATIEKINEMGAMSSVGSSATRAGADE